MKLPDFLQRFFCIYIKHTRKNSKICFYVRGFFKQVFPNFLCRNSLTSILDSYNLLSEEEQRYIDGRVEYYCKFKEGIDLSSDAPCIGDFHLLSRNSFIGVKVNSSYFYDAYNYLRYFDRCLKWAFNPGDVNYLFPVPEITKSRPIRHDDSNRNNIIMNLDKVRHFTWVYDPFSWEEKECRIIFRGDIRNKPHRLRFIEMWKDHEWCDLANTSTMSLYDHLKYRYVMALEGNDVASNLKWVMSSNSVAVMPRPKFETWYMEGRLIANYHYIEIADDYHDLIERIAYYEAHPEEVRAIVRHAHEWVAQFQNSYREDLISLMVLEKYFEQTGQKEIHRVPVETARAKRMYFVNEQVKLASYDRVNAQGKARKDVVRTFCNFGFTLHNIVNLKYSLGYGKRFHHYPFISNSIAYIQAKIFLRRIMYGDVVCIQDFYQGYMQTIASECLKRGAKVIFLIHDIHSIRYKFSAHEIDQLNNASLLLVHTKNMAEKLIQLGVTTPMRIMWLFDYYTSMPVTRTEDIVGRKTEVVFAGNLTKSEFLKELFTVKYDKELSFNLYGIIDDVSMIPISRNFKYYGVFEPEHIEKVQGGWGLVWDGTVIDQCAGNYGEYLRYNSSHKTSLYLVCGMPIIVWEESALASWVLENKIGIAVSSLKDLDEKVNSISEEEYRKMLINVRALGDKLRHGQLLADLLQKYFEKTGQTI